MLMRALSVHIAHETAGAARIRHSLRPLYFRGRRLLAKLGRIVPRECEVMCDAFDRTKHRPRPVRRSSRSEGGRRATQYSRDVSDRTEKLRRTGCPPEPVIGRAEGETRWRA